jgi:hypothetical protein
MILKIREKSGAVCAPYHFARAVDTPPEEAYPEIIRKFHQVLIEPRNEIRECRRILATAGKVQ